ncbi:MAG TPA: hypothetical protein P5513_05900 [Candidatus Diapherotrites archaeon]|nr:hypothetical protein [Candidatus Diapherotrites archaeon]
MAIDVFNNPTNDYVYPALSPCSGVPDSASLKFIKDGIGIISGKNILEKIDFSNISIPVNSYSTESKIIKPGEIIYIPGLTKGIQKRRQGFLLPYLVSDNYTLNPYFFQIDLSINYYKNFRFYNKSIDVSANYQQNLSIIDSLNIEFGNLGIDITVSIDSSALIFNGNLDGFDFSISNVILGIIDASMNSSSPFPKGANSDSYILEESNDYNIPYSKYLNGAMQGILMKSTYPPGSYSSIYDRWLYINHSSNYVTLYLPIEIDNFIKNIRKDINISFDPSIIFGPFLYEIPINIPDFICVSTGTIYDPSIFYIIPQDSYIDGSIIYNTYIEDCSVINSEIYYSDILNFKITSNSILLDSSVYGSNIYDTTSFSRSNVIGSFISDSSMFFIDVSSPFIQSSWIKNSIIYDTSLTCVDIYENSYIEKSDISNSTLNNIVIRESNLNKVLLNDSSIESGITKIIDSSISRSYINDSELNNVDVSLCEISNSFIENSTILNSSFYDSSILNSILNDDISIYNSVIQNSWTNAYKLWVDPSEYIWIIEDYTLSLADPSSRVKIENSSILDVSLYNVYVKDSSIYTSYISDSSLINCTLYNVKIDPSTTTLENCKTVQINMSIDCSVEFDIDSSIYYEKYIKKLDVGLNGSSAETIMSAGDYLDWINTNDLWKKFGDMYIWTSAPDLYTGTNNLINGFYVYNPHDFEVKIEYMLFV